MKKLALLIAALAVVLPLSSAMAAPTCTPAGCVTVNEGGYVLVLDGDAANPDPGDGFISVSSGGRVCSDDNGTADDGNAANGPESTSPMCNP
jgi:hypothetical protein